MNIQNNILFTFLGLFLCLNVFAQHPEGDVDVPAVRKTRELETLGLTEAEQENYLKLMANMEISQPQPMGLGRAIFQDETKLAAAKKALSLGLGVSSAWAWSIVFGANSNVNFFVLRGQDGDSAAPLATPLAVLMFVPSTAIVHELLDDLIAGVEKPVNKKEMLRLAARVANLGFAGQGIVGDVAVYGRVSWSSRVAKVKNTVDAGTYYLAGTYVLTNLLDRISMGNGVIDWAYNRIQYRMNRNAEDNLLKKNIVAELQSQLRHAYQNVVDMDDEQALCTRRQIGQLYRGAKTDAGKQQAKLQSLLLLMGLGNAGAETMWTPQKKPFSLKAAKAFFGSLGFTLGYGATLGTYWAFDEDNRFDPVSGYKYLQPLDSPNAWAYSAVFGSYSTFVGLMTGRKLGEDLWSSITGVDVNQYRRVPEFQPQNVRGVRTLVSLANLLVVRGLAEIPNAGMSTELLVTANKEISFFTYQRHRQQALLAGALMGYIVSSQREFDRHYQNVITNLARWRKTDPLTTARDDLRKMIIQFHDGVGELDPDQTKQLSELLDKAKGQEHEAQVADIAESSFSSSGSEPSNVAVAEKGDVAVDLGAGLSEVTDVDERAGEAGLRAGLLTDVQRALAEIPSSGSDSGSGGQEFEGLLDAEEGAQLLGDQSKKGWLSRLRTWLIGPDVPADLKHLVDVIPVS